MAARIQLSRAKGFKLPFGAVKVDRTTPFGNPYRIGEPIDMKRATAETKYSALCEALIGAIDTKAPTIREIAANGGIAGH